MDKINDKNVKFGWRQENCVLQAVPEKRKARRIPSHILRQIRNNVSIQPLIQNELGLKHTIDGKIFRFECPDCASFHTSIHKKTNLAKCFECQSRFNPIDIVMAVRKTDFLETADFLQGFLGPGADNTSRYRKSNKFCKISDVISESIIPDTMTDSSKHEKRISNLEKEIDKLQKRLEQLYKFFVNEISNRRS